MKRLFALLLCLCLALSACGGQSADRQPTDQPTGQPTDRPEPTDSAGKTPEELAEAYTQAIYAARDEEMNEYFPAMTNATENDPTEQEMVFAMLGFAPEDAEGYALSISLMNVNAYAIVAVKPAKDKEETVKTGLEGYIESQKANFERYLEDQYEIAASAKLETLDDGTVLLVMCDGQDAVFDSIKAALEG